MVNVYNKFHACDSSGSLVYTIKPTSKYVFYPDAICSLSKYKNLKFVFFPNIHYRTPFQNPILSVAITTSTSEVCESARLLMQILGNCKLRG
jgi:hypothetical protein